MPNPVDHLDTLIDKIESGNREIVHERDRELILELDDRLRLLREEYGAHRRLKIIQHATRMAEHAGCLANAAEDRDEAEGIVAVIRHRGVPFDRQCIPTGWRLKCNRWPANWTEPGGYQTEC